MGALKAVVTASAPGSTGGKIRSTSGHMCTRASGGAGCSLRQNYEGDGVGKATKFEWSKSVSECCTACTAQSACAMFVFNPSTNGNGVNTCTLWTATGSNGKVVDGVVTASPKR